MNNQLEQIKAALLEKLAQVNLELGYHTKSTACLNQNLGYRRALNEVLAQIKQIGNDLQAATTDV